MPLIPASDLTAFATRLLTAAGFTALDARAMADLLVWANLRGADSHGVLRIPRYVEMLEAGQVRSGQTVTCRHEFGAVAVLDGGKCPGAIGMAAAVDKAADIADRLGVGWCAVRAISHAGAIGYFAADLAARGKVALVMAAAKPLMSYFGARGEALSTSPLAIAAPRRGQDPLLLDMSTAAVPLGKIMAARDAGRAIPPGWGIDAEGRDTTDPAAVAALLPMAGAKGSGLSLMIEVLTSVLAGAPIIAPALTEQKKGGFNGLVIAVDPAAFGQRADFDAGIEDLARAIHALPPAEGVPAVLLPGERGANTARDRAAMAIPLAAGTADRLADLARRLQVDLPGAFA